MSSATTTISASLPALREKFGFAGDSTAECALTLLGVNYVLIHTMQKKAMQTISATELARNTREILDRVGSLGESIAIERNHTLIAELVPPTRTMTAAQAFAGLNLPLLTAAQANAWLADSKDGFNDAVRDPWA